MPFLPLGPFRPDQPDTVPGRLADLLNASLKVDGEGVAYGPLRGFAPVGVLPSPFSASTQVGAIRGALTCVTSAGVTVVFLMTSEAIYRIAADATTTEIGNGYNLPDGDMWGACQYGDATSDYAVFSNTADGMFKYDLNSGGTVDPVSGAPAARIVATVFDSLFALDCDGNNKLIRYSNINSFSFTTGTAGYQPCPDGEDLMGIAEITDGIAVVLQRNAIRELYRNDSIAMFTSRKPVSNKGAVNPWCIVPVNGAVYFRDTDGFKRYGGAGLEAIGRAKVDQWWLDEVSTDGLQRIDGTYDAENERIYWRYKTAGDTLDDALLNGLFARSIYYDIPAAEFMPVAADGVIDGYAALFNSAAPGYTMEELDAFGDMDDLDPNLSLDDRFWFGGDPRLAAVAWLGGSQLFFGYMSGNSVSATFETTTLSDNQDSRITWVRPVTDAETVEVQVGRSQRLQDALTWNTAAGLQPSGRVAVSPETRGKNHRIRATIDASDDWTYFRGFDDVKYTPPGGVK